VVEVGRPKRSARRAGAKSDALDAVRAAREALACDHLLVPRRRGDREALRVLLATRQSACIAKVGAMNQLKALIVGAPEELRAELRGLATKQQIRRCAALRDRPARSLEHRMTVRALRSTAPHPAAGRRGCRVAGRAGPAGRRCHAMAVGAARHRTDQRRPDPDQLVTCRPAPLPSRLRCLAGVNPIPASSGQVTRHRLNRSGDCQLNPALHTIVLARVRDDPQTRAYAARRKTEGKSGRDVRRCLKRAVARQLFKLLGRHDRAVVEVIRA